MTKEIKVDPEQRKIQLAQALEKILLEYATSKPERQLQLRHVIDDKNRQYKQITGVNYNFKYGDFKYDGRLI